MSRSLTTNFSSPPPNKLNFGKFDFDDDNEILSYWLELKTGIATDAVVCRVLMTVTNVNSTFITRQASPPVGAAIEDVNRYFVVTTRSTPGGYTAAKAADTGATQTKAARRTANELHQTTGAGHIDPVTLATS